MTSSGMAIDPSLLFMQGQQAAQQQKDQQKSTAAPGETDANTDHPQAGGQAQTGANKDDEDSKPDVGSLRAQDHGQTQTQADTDATMQAVDSAAGEDGKTAEAPVDPRQSEEDLALARFLAKMDDYEPILPDAVARYYLEKAGFQSADVRVTRMLGLAAQRFVSDIAADAYAYARVRATTGVGRAPAAAANPAVQNPSSKAKDRTKTVLTLDDLSAALHEYGIDAARAPYYR